MKHFLSLVLLMSFSVAAGASSLWGISTLESGYLVEDKVNYRVSFPQPGKVGVQADANTCSVDSFGRAGACTRVLYPVQVYEADELLVEGGLRLFVLSPELRLVNQKMGVGGSSAYLLKVNPQGEALKRIPLFGAIY